MNRVFEASHLSLCIENVDDNQNPLESCEILSVLKWWPDLFYTTESGSFLPICTQCNKNKHCVLNTDRCGFISVHFVFLTMLFSLRTGIVVLEHYEHDWEWQQVDLNSRTQCFLIVVFTCRCHHERQKELENKTQNKVFIIAKSPTAECDVTHADATVKKAVATVKTDMRINKKGHKTKKELTRVETSTNILIWHLHTAIFDGHTYTSI